MADDSMLVNFAIDDSGLAPNLSFKGGRWKDRLTAKKAARRRLDRLGQRTDKHDALDNDLRNDGRKLQAVTDAENENWRPIKRQRRDNRGERESIPFAPNTLQNPTSKSKVATRDKALPQQFVSSLFSSNPEPKTELTNEPEDDGSAKPSNAPLTGELDTFTSLGLSPGLANHLMKKLNLKAPTAIQRAAVPQLLREDTDAFIQAETGSGKTLAYLLPVVERITRLSEGAQASDATNSMIKRNSGLFAIILAPTRELCKQISVVLDEILHCAHWIVSGTVIGGEKKKSEKARLRKGLNILVATPGRLVDHLENTEALDVSNVRWLVLDEGDRLMELGFEEEIQGIVKKLDARQVTKSNEQGFLTPRLPSRRNTILCSATMKMNVQRLGEISLKEAVHIKGEESSTTDPDRAANSESAFSAPAQLRQSYLIVPAKLRLVTLAAALKRAFARRGSVMKAIVFISCADSVDFHFEVFSKAIGDHKAETASTDDEVMENAPNKATKDTIAKAVAFSTEDSPVSLFKLHGSLPQNVRTATLTAFSKSKDPAVLICTDVASRGLDLPNVDLVIEYDPAFSKEDHLHRIGRTARAGNEGRALLFLLPGDEESYVGILKESNRNGGRGLIRSDTNDLLKKAFGSTGLGAGNDWETRATDWQLGVERCAVEDVKFLELARRSYQSHLRAYATHVAAERHIFNIKTLHLGHMAKSFALRDKPGSIKVPGMKPGDSNGIKTGKKMAPKDRSSGANSRSVLQSNQSPNDGQEAARRMREKLKEQSSGAAEFNIG
ncbi:DEAD-domain-containing protein [Xylona heveae TC161]|uniref:ATP-dependent RNA helicase n=1 Tax=Xylona heveae (strain CBS 132557 / TC161) TaxID=1328760 RepID=A0A165H8X1_XYLHT|nr:DEAD-domain-containing protein [Xylona heveae TC161]KZF23149.1 DEAD-domain-containing protein [Xylona heveae TC161]